VLHVVELSLEALPRPAGSDLPVRALLRVGVAALDHEPGDHAVETRAVVEAVLAQLDEVAGVAGRLLGQEADDHLALAGDQTDLRLREVQRVEVERRLIGHQAQADTRVFVATPREHDRALADQAPLRPERRRIDRNAAADLGAGGDSDHPVERLTDLDRSIAVDVGQQVDAAQQRRRDLRRGREARHQGQLDRLADRDDRDVDLERDAGRRVLG